MRYDRHVRKDKIDFIYLISSPVPVALLSKARFVLDRSITGFVVSNSARDLDICQRCLCCAVLCNRGLGCKTTTTTTTTTTSPLHSHWSIGPQQLSVVEVSVACKFFTETGLLALYSNPQPGEPGLHIYITWRLGGPVIPPGTEYPF
jgi:hypothetical protein